MSFLTWATPRLARWLASNQRAYDEDVSEKVQRQVLNHLIAWGWPTTYWKENGYQSIRNYSDFKNKIPLRTYEEMEGYINRARQGEKDVLWMGKPKYFAKTSGTTGGNKYIPITSDSISNHLWGARYALLHYVYETGDIRFLKDDHKMVFLSGSPQLQQENGIPTGRLSGIVNHHIPRYLRKRQLPSYETNCITDWEMKLDKIVDETIHANMSLISGIPPWVQMYFDKLQQRTRKSIGEIFPDLAILIHGGMRFEPYRHRLVESIGRKVATIETYATSEGFIACQNSQEDEGLLLQLDSGIFFEFIPLDSLHAGNPRRLWIPEVKVGVDYAIVISTNAGLWAYLLGDTVRFTSLRPPKIVVTGRTKQFISAFGEHVIVEEIEKAMSNVLAQHPQAQVAEYMVVPRIGQQKGESSYHEWFIEFRHPPADMDAFASDLDKWMYQQNSYYKDLIEGHVLVPLKITALVPDAFRSYMRETGKLGEQNKIIRVANDRVIADKLSAYRITIL